MTREDRSAAVAQTILISAFKIVFPDAATRISAINDIITVLVGEKENLWTRRDISRQVEASADKLAQRLAEFESHEFPGLDEGEKVGAISGVCESLKALHITKEQIINKNASVEAVYAALVPAAHSRWHKSLISGDAVEYGRAFLREASRFIINIVRDMPDFAKDVSLTNLKITRQILVLLGQSIDNVVLPRYRSGTSAEASKFEANYRSEMIQRNKDVELFGVHIPVPELKRQALDIAYITLSVTFDTFLNDPAESPGGSVVHEYSSNRGNIDHTLGAIIVNAGSRKPRQGARILLTGPAGSGKTTLVQWLAVHCARSSFSRSLAVWNTYLPFVLKLRHLFHEDIEEVPGELEILEEAVNRRSSMPGDWIINALDNRKILLLVDGFDEMSEYEKRNARIWLETFIANHPSADVILTSRPEGLDLRWFSRHSFATLSLESMGPDNIKDFIEGWFKAVAAVAPEMSDVLLIHKQSLLHDVKHRTSVRELAETPLVCAMLCAFYAYEVSESAPESRGDLYEQLIETLVDKRDRVRNAIQRDRRRFTSNEKLILLQAVARYLTEQQLLAISTRRASTARGSSQSTEPVETSAQGIIEQEARSLVNLSLSPADALEYLLQRSIIFREVVPGEVQFVHRSIQEFLTARSFATTGEVSALIRYIGSTQWNQIISFAAARLDSRNATRLIGAILDRADSALSDKRDLLLLAAECLSTARVDANLVVRASQALEEILPPRSMREAELLGRSGDGVVRLLSGYAHESEETIAACLHAAAVAGTPVGMGVIASYLPHIRSAQLKLRLIDAWQYFDIENYAKAILARVSFDNCLVRFTSAESLNAASSIRGLRKVEIDLHAGNVDFASWRRLASLRELDCSKFRSLSSLSGLSAIPNLQRLNLSNRSLISDFSEVGLCAGLIDLYLDSCGGLTNADFLASLAALRVLSLNRCINLRNFEWLGQHTSLLTLHLNGCHVDSLSFAAHLDRLAFLGAESVDGFEDFAVLESCRNLTRLGLSVAHSTRPLKIPENLRLRSLSLSGSLTTADLQCLSNFPELTKITAVGVQGLEDLRPLSIMRNLRVLRLLDCGDLYSCSGVEDLIHLRTLELISCNIRYPHIPRHLEQLKEINLDGNPYLGSIEEVIWLPNLEKLTLPPMDSTVLQWMELQAANPGLVVVCDAIPGGYETG